MQQVIENEKKNITMKAIPRSQPFCYFKSFCLCSVHRLLLSAVCVALQLSDDDKEDDDGDGDDDAAVIQWRNIRAGRQTLKQACR